MTARARRDLLLALAVPPSLDGRDAQARVEILAALARVSDNEM